MSRFRPAHAHHLGYNVVHLHAFAYKLLDSSDMNAEIWVSLRAT